MPLLKLYSSDHQPRTWRAGNTSQSDTHLARSCGAVDAVPYKGAYGNLADPPDGRMWHGIRTEIGNNWRISYVNLMDVAKATGRTGRVLIGTALRNYNYSIYEQYTYFFLSADSRVGGLTGTYPLDYLNCQAVRYERKDVEANLYRERTYVEMEIDFDREVVTVWQDNVVISIAPIDAKFKDSPELYVNIGYFYGGTTTYGRVLTLLNDTYIYHAPPGDHTGRFGDIRVGRSEVVLADDAGGDWTATDGGTLEDAINVTAADGTGLPGIDTDNTAASIALNIGNGGFDSFGDKLFAIGVGMEVWDSTGSDTLAIETKVTFGGEDYPLADVSLVSDWEKLIWAGGSFAKSNGEAWTASDMDSTVLDLTVKVV